MVSLGGVAMGSATYGQPSARGNMGVIHNIDLEQEFTVQYGRLVLLKRGL